MRSQKSHAFYVWKTGKALYYFAAVAALAFFAFGGRGDLLGWLNALPRSDCGANVGWVSPADLVSAVVCNKEADPTVTLHTDKSGLPTVWVIYSLEPWSLSASHAHGAFDGHLRALVPAIFQHFPQFLKIDVVGTAVFTDLRGNSGRMYAVHAVFTRANAQSIHWDKIEISNVAMLADSYWSRPGF
jgi:hypothetical protein